MRCSSSNGEDARRHAVDHLAFGHGTHARLGALLAETEARVGLELLLARLPEYEVVETGVERLHSGPIRGLARLPVAFWLLIGRGAVCLRACDGAAWSFPSTGGDAHGPTLPWRHACCSIFGQGDHDHDY